MPHAVSFSPQHTANTTLAAWHSGNGVGRINEVTIRRARLVLKWVTCPGSTPIGSTLFRYVTQPTKANSAFHFFRVNKLSSEQLYRCMLTRLSRCGWFNRLTLLYIVLPCVAAVVSRPAWRMSVLLIARNVCNLINEHYYYYYCNATHPV